MIKLALEIVNSFLKNEKETCLFCREKSAQHRLPDGGSGRICDRCRAQFDESHR